MARISDAARNTFTDAASPRPRRTPQTPYLSSRGDAHSDSPTDSADEGSRHPMPHTPPWPTGARHVAPKCTSSTPCLSSRGDTLVDGQPDVADEGSRRPMSHTRPWSTGLRHVRTVPGLIVLAAVLAVVILARDASASFGGRDLISTPTADVLPRGMFVAALTGGYRAEDPFDRTGAALTFDFGLGQRLQGGASWRAASGPDSSMLSWDARALVVREDGALPNVSIAAAELGEGKEHALGLGLVSKEFNLPSVGFFQLHVGVKTPLYPDASDADVKPIGGIEKTWYALNRDWRGIAEWNGDAFSIGVEQRFREGVRIGVAFETDTPRVLFSVGFANEPIVTEIDSAKRLARQAARLATRPEARLETLREDDK